MESRYTFGPGEQRMLGIDITGADLGPYRLQGTKNATPMEDLLDLSGKVAIVTGGARGLGLCVVNRLCEAGARVVIADIAVEFAQAALEFFSTKDYDVRFIETDVRHLPQIQAAVDYTVGEFGGVDILVNNAAIWRFDSFVDLPEEAWDDVVDTNLKGTVYFTQVVARRMVEQGEGGKIVNVASVAGLAMENGFGWMTPYVASKSGVVALSQSLARELKPLGIAINCVVPGGMLTSGGMLTPMSAEAKAAKAAAPAVPVTDPDDVARLVYVMATRISDFMHGATVVADGGARLMIQQ